MLTEDAAIGLARALGIPVAYGGYDIKMINGVSKRLPIYGIVESCSGPFVTASWYYQANKFAYERTFPRKAIRCINEDD